MENKREYNELNIAYIETYIQAIARHIETISVLKDYKKQFKDDFNEEEDIKAYLEEIKRMNNLLTEYLSEFK